MHASTICTHVCTCWLSELTPFLAETMQPLITNTRISVSVSPDPESLLVEERQKVLDFFTKGCGCAIFKDRPCSGMFNYEYIYDFRSQCAELTREELDMMLLGQLSALTDTSEQSANSLVHRHSPASRQRSYTHFVHRGKRICRNTFLFLHNISAKKLKKAAFFNVELHHVPMEM